MVYFLPECNMRLALGDPHGRSFWKNYRDEEFSEYYITGDYFDSFDIPFAEQYRNFEELCEAARQDPRIKLCLGNHDYQYVEGVHGERYSGYQDSHCFAIRSVLEKNIDLLKVVYVTQNNYIISHAGVSAWFMNTINKAGVISLEGINDVFNRDRTILKFYGYNPYGDDITQSPIWIRPRSLEKQPLPGYNQIVGHTEMRRIKEVVLPDDKKGSIKIVYVDTGDREEVYRF
jgi:hypothetical protein